MLLKQWTQKVIKSCNVLSKLLSWYIQLYFLIDDDNHGYIIFINMIVNMALGRVH